MDTLNNCIMHALFMHYLCIMLTFGKWIVNNASLVVTFCKDISFDKDDLACSKNMIHSMIKFVSEILKQI